MISRLTVFAEKILEPSPGEIPKRGKRQNNTIRSSAASGHVRTTDGVIFPSPFKAQGFEWNLCALAVSNRGDY